MGERLRTQNKDLKTSPLRQVAGSCGPDFFQPGETRAVAVVFGGQALGQRLARLAEVRLILGAM
jgi:hypothetical protein